MAAAMASDEKEPAVDVDCVIIGVNAAKTLARCIQSLLDGNYPRDCLHIVYADGGSSDESLNIAKSFPGVQVVALHPEHPTPGLGRNAGWKIGTAPFVQFADSDTVIHPDWIRKGVSALLAQPATGAVLGELHEMYPQASVFNWIGDLEWNAKPGQCEAFGGDVMVRRELLERTGGYNEELVGGEDPELSQRFRLLGYTIQQLGEPMAMHDLAMTRLAQYWKRAYRTGYGFAAVTTRFLTRSRGFWFHELVRILIRGGGSLFLIGLALLLGPWIPTYLLLLPVGATLLFYPRIFRVPYFMADKGISREQAKTYAMHCSLIVIPEIFGAVRFWWGLLLSKPLRNKRSDLSTRSL